MTTISVQSKQISITLGSVDIVRSCILSPPVPQPILPPDERLWVPVAPGITYEVLPPPPTIIDTSPNQIIGCIESIANNPQTRLNTLFPDAGNGDGVIDRETNDIWVFDGNEWNNVGPNPGPTVIIEQIVPVWNETVINVGITKTTVNVFSFPYAFELLTNIVAKTRSLLSFAKVTTIRPTQPILFNVGYIGPAISAGNTLTIINTVFTSGTAAPLLGAGQVLPEAAAEAGWEIIYNSSNDERSIASGNFGFPFMLNTQSYESCFINSNAYLTFGGIQNVYENLGAAIPSLPKLLFGSGDWSFQRVYTKKTIGSFRIRWEGNSNYAASEGNSNRFVEIAFYKQLAGEPQYLEVRAGNISGATGPFMIATASTELASTNFTSNESWVFIGEEEGTIWTIETAAHIEFNVSLNVILQQPPDIALTSEIPSLQAFVGIGIQPTNINIAINSHTPTVETGIFIDTTENVIQVNIHTPFGIGYKAYIEPDNINIACNLNTINVSSGKVISPNTIEATLSGLLPKILDATKINIPITMCSISAITPTIGSAAIAYCDTVNISLTSFNPVVSRSASILVTSNNIALATNETVVNDKNAIRPPSASISISGNTPSTVGYQIEPPISNISISAIQGIAISAITSDYFSGIANQDYSYEEDWQVDSFAG